MKAQDALAFQKLLLLLVAEQNVRRDQLRARLWRILVDGPQVNKESFERIEKGTWCSVMLTRSSFSRKLSNVYLGARSFIAYKVDEDDGDAVVTTCHAGICKHERMERHRMQEQTCLADGVEAPWRIRIACVTFTVCI